MTDTDTTPVGKTTPRAVKVGVWLLTAAMILVALFGFNVASGHNLVPFGVLVGLFAVQLVVVSKWQK